MLARALGLLGQLFASLRKRVASRPLIYIDFRTTITHNVGPPPSKLRTRKRKR
jgi:hypothetical protein